MSIIILDRDDHYIDVLQGHVGEIIIAHRWLDQKDKSDSSDLHFTKTQARKLIRAISYVLKNNITYEKCHIIDKYDKYITTEEKDGEVTVYIHPRDKELTFHPNRKQWIGIGFQEAEILLEKLKEMCR